MTFNKLKWLIFLRVALLLAALILVAFIITKGVHAALLIALPLVIFQTVNLYIFQLKYYKEVNQFVEAVHYRDFSVSFNENAPAEIKELRKGLNKISAVLRDLSKEKETQHQYLQNILELIETGILCYEEESGEVLWMNEALKTMLRIPYLKKIESIKARFGHLYEAITGLKYSEQKLISFETENVSFKVLLAASVFQTGGKQYKLVAFQNVNEVVEETEARAWQKLLSVMTHEIMNSIAPISSLAETLGRRLDDFSCENTAPDQLDDLKVGIETIKRRSEGLQKFAETYRSLSKINTLNLEKVYIQDLFFNLQQLMRPTLTKKNIQLQITVNDPELFLQADANLLEQVLINLLVNAIDAVKDRDNPLIHLWADTLPNKKIILKVIDNGAGMQDDVLENIFIPFFTTKKNGSGIGLSLCKQIVMLHHGTLQAQSVLGQGSVFSIQF